MEGFRKTIAVFLILLFIIIFVGVTLSKIAEKNKGKKTTTEQQGALTRIFFPIKNTPTPAMKFDDSKNNNTVVIKETGTPAQGNNRITPMPTMNIVKGQPVYQNPSGPVSNIPSTGAPTEVILMALGGLASGLYLRKSK